MTIRRNPNPYVPEVVWAVAEEHVIEQYTMCVRCGPSPTPDKVFFVQGTSYCSEHAREALPQ